MIIAIDTETGGTNPAKHPLLSISACLVERPEKNFTVFIQPDPKLTIEAEAARVNGYTPELWIKRGAVPLRVALARFKAWLPYSGNAPCAHNADFDEDFMSAAEEQANFKTYLKKSWHCSRKLFMGVNEALQLNAPNFQLVTLAKMCGHWPADYQRGDHQSLDDVLACAAGWRWLIQKIRAGAPPPPVFKDTFENVVGKDFVRQEEFKL